MQLTLAPLLLLASLALAAPAEPAPASLVDAQGGCAPGHVDCCGAGACYPANICAFLRCRKPEPFPGCCCRGTCAVKDSLRCSILLMVCVEDSPAPVETADSPDESEDASEDA